MKKSVACAFLAVVFVVAAWPQTAIAPHGPAIVGDPRVARNSSSAGSRSLSLFLYPSATIPIADSADLFTFGGGARIGAEYGFGGDTIRPFAGVGAGYALAPFKANDSLSIMSAELLGGTYLEVGPRMLLRAAASAGYFYGLINSDGTGGSNPLFSAGLGVSYLLNRSLDLSAGVSYRNYLGLYHGIAINIGTSFYLSGREIRQERINAAAPIRPELLQGAKRHVPGTGVELQSVSLDDLFPVFQKYYDDHPAGRTVLVNRESVPIDGIRLTYFIKQYMDSAKECPAPDKLGPNESLAVDVNALFTDRILEATEATKVAAEVVLEYRKEGELYRDVRTSTVRVLDRNAMTWDDDRRAAAFVTAKDPAVLSFSKGVAGEIRDKGPQAVNGNLLSAMAVHQTLDLYGLSYVVDPKSSYSDFSSQKSQVDYLQFPRQTLEFRGGDCDDLSILYTALLESIGVESAFIIVPGHIYASFNLGMTKAEAEREFSSVADLIEHDGAMWVPVEITDRRNGFLAAWQEGAKEWRDAAAHGAAILIPIREAWSEYESVALPGAAGDVPLPPTDRISAAFTREAGRFVDREIYPKVTRLESEIRSSGGTPAARNRLGILYAKYGKLDKAEEQFTLATSRGTYVPAMINLGNVHYLRKNYAQAQAAYERASRADPRNCTALVCLAKVYREEEKYGEAKTSYDKLAALDPATAARYAYLGGASGDTGRASAVALGGDVLWGDE